jgi:uncharacterized phage-associated protein
MMRLTPHGEAAVAHVQDVAAYILDKLGPMTAMKLQKLCYYSYAYHLAWEDRKLFPEHFEAWANGPVAPALYRLHRGTLTVEPGDIPGDPRALDGGEKESVDLVLDAYGSYSAHQLSLMTHNEKPWQAARKRGKAGPLDRSHVRLRDSDIFEYFDSRTAADGSAEA